MSWIQGLYDTFEANKSLIGRADTEDAYPLLPICHTTQQAHIEIVLNEKGEFLRALVVPREDNRTIIPCTELSASRAGIKPVNHPLCDKLQYIAGDFEKYGGVVTSGFLKNPSEPYENYSNDLKNWVASPYSVPKIKAILNYVEGKTVVQDLINYGVLHVDAEGKLLEEWESEEERPDIFGVLPSGQSQYDAFVRWRVEVPGILETAVWKDEKIIDGWISYYVSLQTEQALCYVTGQEELVAISHPDKIRNDGDRAKLISSNDTSGFTFRGRFTNAQQAASVGYEVTQKAHNMLRWLVRSQGFRNGDLAIVAWAQTGQPVPDITDDSLGFLDISDIPEPESVIAYTGEEFANKLRRKVLSFQAELGEMTDIYVMVLDSATPGRMAIKFYRELSSSEFLRRIEDWHNTCAWRHNFARRQWGIERKMYPKEYIGAPSLPDIAEAIYGGRVDAKLKNKTIERLLPCVIDGQAIPKDIVALAVQRACKRVSLEAWEWNKALTIACSLYRKANLKEGYELALEEKRRSRDYLYGRLLALADSIEGWALSEANEQRQTNAARLMQRFADRPFSTWKVLELSLGPYKARLGPKVRKRESQISEVMALFEPEDFVSDRKLSGEFLLGYHCQKVALWQKVNDKDE
ncbi:MAG: type I-C CRISPR-associated protein Cas8c/Csd1 [Firmicutes bacterium]|nr:type I-C CRISPR-associated protein Cas8c/Csd1 [Bacillota bacterium]